jgi:hypothetical protein
MNASSWVEAKLNLALALGIGINLGISFVLGNRGGNWW